MKKAIFIISAMILTATTSHSQTTVNADPRNNIYYGFKFGGTYSDIYDVKTPDGTFNSMPKFGIAFGASISLPLSPLFGIQSEILLAEKGYKATGTTSGNSFEFTHTSTYLDMPLFLTVKPSNLVTILVGTRYSFLIDQIDRFSKSTNSEAQKATFRNETTRGSLSVGGGFDINIKSFVIGGRANWDLTNNRLDEKNVVTPLYKNMWYQLTVGFRFL